MLTCENEINFVFGVQLILHYPETFCWQLSPQEFPRFSPHPTHTFSLCRGSVSLVIFRLFFLCSWLRSCIRVSKTWRDDVKCVLLDVLWTLLCSDASLESGAIMVERYHMGKPICTIHTFQYESKANWDYYLLLTGSNIGNTNASLESGAIMMERYHVGKLITFICFSMNQKLIWDYYHLLTGSNNQFRK